MPGNIRLIVSHSGTWVQRCLCIEVSSSSVKRDQVKLIVQHVLIVSLPLIPEPGVCFDESEKCQEFSKEGKCTNTALHKYANFCKKSCGLCGKFKQKA